MTPKKLKVLFVCMGNICRSPLAEGVFRHLVTTAGLDEHFIIDSAGTGSWHVGDPPDARTTAVARARGVEVSGAARQVILKDLSEFDYVLVMDEENLTNVQRIAKGKSTTAEVKLLREFDPAAFGDFDVPDPYYGGPRGFELVHDIVERSCATLLDHIRAQHHI